MALDHVPTQRSGMQIVVLRIFVSLLSVAATVAFWYGAYLLLHRHRDLLPGGLFALLR